jgi:hypothetical protein
MDLLVLAGSDQLLFILKLYFSSFQNNLSWLGNCDIHAKQNILFLNETKRYKIWPMPKSLVQISIKLYCQILLKFLSTIDLLFKILDEGVNCTEPSPSVRVPWFAYCRKKLFFLLKNFSFCLWIDLSNSFPV